MKRRDFLHCAVAGAVGVMANSLALGEGAEPRHPEPPPPPPGLELEEATIPDLQAGMQAGSYTARSLTEMYLARVDALDKRGANLNAVIEVNPHAVAVADALDKERRTSGPRGPLHGIPVLIKDNIDTGDEMQTTAGSLALLGFCPAQDAFLVARLREAGAVILGKTNLSEWANIRSERSSSGWSGRGGQTRNPYVLDSSLRNQYGGETGIHSFSSCSTCGIPMS